MHLQRFMGKYVSHNREWWVDRGDTKGVIMMLKAKEGKACLVGGMLWEPGER